MPQTEAQAEPRYMARALRLAARGRYSCHPNPRVGCVIVAGGQIVGEGFHAVAGEAHAEVHALQAAGERAKGADVYVTLEPCSHQGRTPPCADALIAAQVGRVIVAMRDPNPKVAGQGLERLAQAGIPVVVGMMQNAAQQLNPGFVFAMQHQRPRVCLKLASSLDGRTAMASGESQWISGEAARADVHRLRAEFGAVLTGSATVIADDPALTVRIPPPEGASAWRQPVRMVLDSALKSPPKARIFEPGARRIVITCATDTYKRDALAQLGVELQVTQAAADGSVPLQAALSSIAACGINELLLECGPRLAGAFLQARLVDELLLYVAPKLLGHAARPLANLPGLDQLADAIDWDIQDCRRVGRDLRIRALPEAR